MFSGKHSNSLSPSPTELSILPALIFTSPTELSILPALIFIDKFAEIALLRPA